MASVTQHGTQCPACEEFKSDSLFLYWDLNKPGKAKKCIECRLPEFITSRFRGRQRHSHSESKARAAILDIVDRWLNKLVEHHGLSRTEKDTGKLVSLELFLPSMLACFTLSQLKANLHGNDGTIVWVNFTNLDDMKDPAKPLKRKGDETSRPNKVQKTTVTAAEDSNITPGGHYPLQLGDSSGPTHEPTLQARSGRDFGLASEGNNPTTATTAASHRHGSGTQSTAALAQPVSTHTNKPTVSNPGSASTGAGAKPASSANTLAVPSPRDDQFLTEPQSINSQAYNTHSADELGFDSHSVDSNVPAQTTDYTTSSATTTAPSFPLPSAPPVPPFLTQSVIAAPYQPGLPSSNRAIAMHRHQAYANWANQLSFLMIHSVNSMAAGDETHAPQPLRERLEAIMQDFDIFALIWNAPPTPRAAAMSRASAPAYLPVPYGAGRWANGEVFGQDTVGQDNGVGRPNRVQNLHTQQTGPSQPTGDAQSKTAAAAANATRQEQFRQLFDLPLRSLVDLPLDNPVLYILAQKMGMDRQEVKAMLVNRKISDVSG
ncbi:MAG: hypothetical protein M1831_001003 [Alyxoria varia]|nr:MAG: hypothetical protein M1831_001003 [Alyxoria varia]